MRAIMPNCKLILTKEGFKTDTIDFDEYWKNHDYKTRDSLIIMMIPIMN
jgi:hypothetical protein